MLFYGTDLIVLLPALIISFWAQIKVKTTFQKYSKIKSIRGCTGEQVARMLLDANGLFNVPIEVIGGNLTDHYDPTRRVMRLSKDVYYGTSVASIGVAAHETGHAIQHGERYSPLIFRNSIVPIVNISSNLSWILLVLGLFMGIRSLVETGIILFASVVFFQLITLPVEFNASNRALAILESKGVLYDDELRGAKKVLTAAALTYVAAALMAISQLIRLILISREN